MSGSYNTNEFTHARVKGTIQDMWFGLCVLINGFYSLWEPLVAFFFGRLKKLICNPFMGFSFPD